MAGNKSKRGRPTAYRSEMAAEAYRLSLLGYTDAMLAEAFEVAESTINLWKRNHAEFSESVRSGKAVADGVVAESLYRRACGFTVTEQKAVVVGGQAEVMQVERHFPPDTAAAVFWLKNRQPHLWKDKVEVEQKTEVTTFDSAKLDAIYARAAAEMEERRRAIAGRAERLAAESAALATGSGKQRDI